MLHICMQSGGQVYIYSLATHCLLTNAFKYLRGHFYRQNESVFHSGSWRKDLLFGAAE